MHKNKKHTNSIVGIRINKEFKDSYMSFCDKNGYSLSKRIKLFMKKDMNGEINFK